MRPVRFFKHYPSLVVFILVVQHALVYAAEEKNSVSYQEYFDNQLRVFFSEPLGSTQEQLAKDRIILCLNTHSAAHSKLLVHFSFFHPAVETLGDSTKKRKNKKMQLLNAFSEYGHLQPEEYIEQVCALGYYPKFFSAPKMTDVLISQLLNWGINPFLNTAEKDYDFWAERLPTFTRSQWGLSEDSSVRSKKIIPTQNLDNHAVDFYCNKIASYHRQNAHFLKDQIKANNQFLCQRRFPSLFVLSSLALIKKDITIQQNKLQSSALPQILELLQDQIRRKAFLSVLLFHPASTANSFYLDCVNEKLDLLNLLYHYLSPREYFSYRAIIEFLPRFFAVDQMSISVLHKILDMGTDPRLAFEKVEACQKNLTNILWGCDHAWMDLAVKTIIYSKSKTGLKSLECVIKYLKKNSSIDVNDYVLFALNHHRKKIIKYLLTLIQPSDEVLNLVHEVEHG